MFKDIFVFPSCLPWFSPLEFSVPAGGQGWAGLV